MDVPTKIFFMGMAIFVVGFMLAQYNNNNPRNTMWIGAVKLLGMMVTFTGGIIWIAAY